MLHQTLKRSIKIAFVLMTATLSVLLYSKASYAQIYADTAEYQIDIGDSYAGPGEIFEIPIQTKNLNPLGGFLIRFTYDSRVISPLHTATQPDQADTEYLRNSFNFDSPDLIYDSLILTGRGLGTQYIDSSGLYCAPYHNIEIHSNVFAFHNPNDDSMHIETVFLSFLPSVPPTDQCHLDYYTLPRLPPKEDTVDVFANVLFQVKWNVIPGTISDVIVGNYRPSNQEDPLPDFRDNQFTDTLGIDIYHLSSEGMGSGEIHIGEETLYCGNIDRRAGINILDIVLLINYIFKDGPAPDVPDLANVDGNTPINDLDVVYLINFIYKDGPDPACQ